MNSHMATEVQRTQIEIFRGFIDDYDLNDFYLLFGLMSQTPEIHSKWFGREQI